MIARQSAISTMVNPASARLAFHEPFPLIPSLSPNGREGARLVRRSLGEGGRAGEGAGFRLLFPAMLSLEFIDGPSFRQRMCLWFEAFERSSAGRRRNKREWPRRVHFPFDESA